MSIFFVLSLLFDFVLLFDVMIFEILCFKVM